MNYFSKKNLLFIFMTISSGLLFCETYKNHLSDAWYPVKGRSLSRKLQELQAIAQKKYPFSSCLAAAESDSGSSIRAIICPHAGYEYSGAVASAAYQLIKPGMFKRVIILAPYHQNDFSGVSLPGAQHDFYKSPLGWIALDTDVIKKLKKSSPLFVHRQMAHELEHSIEVQIPFIQTYCGDCAVVPLLIGSVSAGDIQNIAKSLLPFSDDKTLLVVSSDFTHYGKQFGYEPFKENITQSIFQLDGAIVEKIQQFDLSGFSQQLQKTQATVCGKSAIMILLQLLQQKAFGQNVASYVVGYDTSAPDKKNPAHSVSYISIVFTKQLPADVPMQDQLTGYEKNLLLKIARQELQQVVMENENKAKKLSLLDPRAKPKDDVNENTLSSLSLSRGSSINSSLEIPGMLTMSLKKAHGVFVTLYKKESALDDKKLRGCIGSITSEKPLYELVADMTESAALRDSRFSPVQLSELPFISISISVLTQPRTVNSYNDIVLGSDGIILKHGNAQAVYLPKVATEQGWNLQQTLSSLSEKAGLDKNIYKDSKTTFEVFQAMEF